MLATIDLAKAKSEELQRVLAIDRYESRARTRRRLASTKLPRFFYETNPIFRPTRKAFLADRAMAHLNGGTQKMP
jgi:hypothetical protein